MSDLAEKLRKQKEEAAAKKTTGTADAIQTALGKKTVTPTKPVDNEQDDKAIAAAKQGHSSTTQTAPAKAEPAMPTEHTVVSGDNLSAIAKKYYGDENRWRDIYNANKATIGDNPSAIRVGMVLKLPA